MALHVFQAAGAAGASEELKARTERIRELEDALAASRHSTEDMEERIVELVCYLVLFLLANPCNTFKVIFCLIVIIFFKCVSKIVVIIITV